MSSYPRPKYLFGKRLKLEAKEEISASCALLRAPDGTCFGSELDLHEQEEHKYHKQHRRPAVKGRF